jgi:predicted phosphodiesterase
MSETPRNPRKRPVFKLLAIDDQEKFKPLPAATGEYPFHLNIVRLVTDLPAEQMIFHMAGDTGSLRSPEFQQLVAAEMGRQYDEAAAADKPSFFFHLGDVVYNFGQAAEYYDQFFYPYQNYPAPIFAISGNHDADVDPMDPQKPASLKAFLKVFCNTDRNPVDFAGDTGFKSNIQPNIYWTLQTPLADFICLYSNVPKFGTITTEQKEWFINELKTSALSGNEKALIVCIHHSAYSADTNHGSSIHMQAFLNEAFEIAGVKPDAVFSGHVHDYQRFNKTYPDGKVVPFIVAGAGGYADLHRIADPGDPEFPDGSKLLDDVILQNYCDDAHGFLKIKLKKENEGLFLTGEYYTIPRELDNNGKAALYDTFEVKVERKLKNWILPVIPKK